MSVFFRWYQSWSGTVGMWYFFWGVWLYVVWRITVIKLICHLNGWYSFSWLRSVCQECLWFRLVCALHSFQYIDIASTNRHSLFTIIHEVNLQCHSSIDTWTQLSRISPIWSSSVQQVLQTLPSTNNDNGPYTNIR